MSLTRSAVVLCLTGTCQFALAQGIITTFAGTESVFTGDGQLALAAAFNVLHGITVDYNGNPVVVDSTDAVVVRLNPDQTLTVLAGNGYSGADTGDGGAAINAGLKIPYGATYDRLGNLYILEGSAIRKVTPSGTISTIAGSVFPGFHGDGGSAIGAQMDSLGGIAVDSAGNIYFADYNNNRVRMIDNNGIITTVAGNGTGGFGGDNGPATAASLYHPVGVAVDSNGNLYIADTFNYRVRKVSNGVITTLYYSTLYGAFSLIVDKGGVLYIGGYDNVYKLPPGATTRQPVAGTGIPGFSGDGGPAVNAQLNGFNGQIDIALDGSGNLFIADESNYRIRKVGLNGVIHTVAGSGPFPIISLGGIGSYVLKLAVPLQRPVDLTFDTDGNLYVAESLNNRVLKISPDRPASPGVATVFAGTGVVGNTGDGGPPGMATLYNPLALAFYKGDLYIADNGNSRIRRVHNGMIDTYATISLPVSIAFDQNGNLYVACRDSTVRKIDTFGNMTVFAGQAGISGSSGDGGPATTALLRQPTGLAVDANGNVFIADYQDSRVRMVTPQGVIRNYAGTGVPGPPGDNGPAVSATLCQPVALTFDAGGNLYIADAGCLVVRIVNRSSGIIATVAGGGPLDLLGDGNSATQASLAPLGLVFDSSGDLYISDALNNRIREVLAAPPTIKVSPTSLSMSAPSGGASVTQTLAVEAFYGAATVAGLDFTASINTGSNPAWLSLDTNSDATPRLLPVIADPGALSPGSYTASVTILAANANASPTTIMVIFTVGAALPRTLAVDKSSLSFPLPQGVGAQTQNVLVSNQGGQTLSYSASIRTNSGANWLSVSPPSGRTTPSNPSTVSVTADPTGLVPGTYTGQLLIQSDGGNRGIPVTMTISTNPQAVLLTQSGLSFTAVAQGGVIPPQYFGVKNIGTGVMNWTATASTTKGGTWLHVSPANGSSDPSQPAPQVRVSVNANGLAAGTYYGTVFVDAPGTANLLRLVTIFLRVLPAGTDYPAAVQPPELVFYTAPGVQTPPGSQSVSLYNVTATGRSFTVGRSAGSVPLFSLPGTGTLDPGIPTRLVIQPGSNAAGGSPYQGALTFQFSDGSVQIVKITIVSSDSPAVPSSARASTKNRKFDVPAGCTPGLLTVTSNTLSPAFQVNAGWTVGLNLTVADDCGNPVKGSPGDKVWVRFSDGEDNVSLIPLGDGSWQQSWKPAHTNQAVTITAFAQSGTLNGSNVISGGTGSDNSQPKFTLTGISNVFDQAPVIRPLAPGSLVSIYGSNLSGSVASAAAPYGTLLAGTQVFFGRMPAPLQYASSGQINAVVPWESMPSLLSQQVRVQSGDQLSDPVSVDLAAAQPAIYQQPGTQLAYALDYPADGSVPFVVSATSPAAASDIVQMYFTGLGATDSSITDGGTSPSSPVANVTGVRVAIGGQNATVQFAGLAPVFVGLYQINAVMPSGVPPGTAAITVNVGGQTSPAADLMVK